VVLVAAATHEKQLSLITHHIVAGVCAGLSQKHNGSFRKQKRHGDTNMCTARLHKPNLQRPAW